MVDFKIDFFPYIYIQQRPGLPHKTTCQHENRDCRLCFEGDRNLSHALEERKNADTNLYIRLYRN